MMNLSHVTDDRMRKIRITAMTFLVFALAYSSRALLRLIPGYSDWLYELPDPIWWLEHGTLWSAICIGGLMAFYRLGPVNALRELGLIAPVWPAYLFAITMTLPMWLPPLILPGFTIHWDPTREVYNAGVWPLGEEILFRGFVFLQLYRRAGWSFWSSAGLSSAVFGLVHLGNAALQQEPIGQQIGSVAMISVLTVFGTWIVIKWDYNLWFLTAGHGAMNFCWSVFELGENPLGGWAANIMRVSAVALAVLFTLKREVILNRLKAMFSRNNSPSAPENPQNGALDEGP